MHLLPNTEPNPHADHRTSLFMSASYCTYVPTSLSKLPIPHWEHSHIFPSPSGHRTTRIFKTNFPHNAQDSYHKLTRPLPPSPHTHTHRLVTPETAAGGKLGQAYPLTKYAEHRRKGTIQKSKQYHHATRYQQRRQLHIRHLYLHY